MSTQETTFSRQGVFEVLPDAHVPGHLDRLTLSKPPALLNGPPINAEGKTFEDLAEQAKELQNDGSIDLAVNKYMDALQLGNAPYGPTAFVYCNLGRCFHLQASFERALNYHQLFLELARAAEDDEMESQARSNLGITLCAMGRYKEALQQHELSMLIAGRTGSPEAQMRCHANIGNVYGAMGNFKQAVLYHNQQLLLARQLNDKSAEARAAYNLENDHNSAQHYEIAATYRKIKTESKESKLPLNSGFVDHRSGDEVRVGWLIKHEGGNGDEPRKISTKRRWCVLRAGIFAYHKTVQSGKRALRYIRITDVADIELIHLPSDGSSSEASPRSCRLHVAGSRYFYFTAVSNREMREWIDAFQLARSAVAQFSDQRQVQSQNQYSGGGSEIFSSRQTFTSKARPVAANPLSTFEDAPVGLSSRSVDNPLYSAAAADSQDPDVEALYSVPNKSAAKRRTLDEEEGNSSGDDDEVCLDQIDVAYGISSGPAGGARQAWARQNTATERAAQSLASGLVSYNVHLLGTVTLRGLSTPPSTKLMYEKYLALVKNPHPTVNQKLLLTATPRAIVVKQPKPGSGVEAQYEQCLEHEVANVANILSFDSSVLVVERHRVTDSTFNFTVYMYRCEDLFTASELKAVLIKRATASGNGLVVSLQDEPDHMITSALPRYGSTRADARLDDGDDAYEMPAVRAISEAGYDSIPAHRKSMEMVQPYSVVPLGQGSGQQRGDLYSSVYAAVKPPRSAPMVSFQGVHAGEEIDANEATPRGSEHQFVGLHPGEDIAVTHHDHIHHLQGARPDDELHVDHFGGSATQRLSGLLPGEEFAVPHDTSVHELRGARADDEIHVDMYGRGSDTVFHGHVAGEDIELPDHHATMSLSGVSEGESTAAHDEHGHEVINMTMLDTNEQMDQIQFREVMSSRL
eukprot:m.100256 g.100256  ORF g.100256 m.100256 type:complete len:918 (-) comp8924_c0_seq1:130-2883(-)